jgi:hypothetical protein
MFKSLFQYPRVFSRHANGPLAEERNTFLKHLASRGTPRSTLLRYARQLRVIAVLLDRHLPGPISREQIARRAQRWAQGQQRRGQAQGLKWPREHFLQVASAWCTFMGWWQEQPRPRAAYHWRIEAWASFLGGPEGLTGWLIVIYHRRTFTGWTASIMGCEQMDTDQKYPEPRCSMARIRSRGSGSEQGEATPDSGPQNPSSSLHLSKEARSAPSRQEQISRHAKAPRQGPHMIKGELAFAA